jgi:hypothetical protein
MSTNLSPKLDASLWHLQLQLGMPHNPLTLDYNKWGHLAPLSWVKMLWRSLHYFNIHLHMERQPIPLPRERDQVVMEIMFGKNLATNTIRSLSQCRGDIEIIVLLDMTTADGQYLEHFVFTPGGWTSRTKYKFPQENPMRGDWEVWFNFWHKHVATGDKLLIPLGKWLSLTHRIWRWFYSPTNNNLYQIKEGKVQHYLPALNCWQTRSATSYTFVWEEDITPAFKTGLPTSVVNFSNNNVNKLNKGDPLAKGTSLPTDFLEFLRNMGRDVDVGRYQQGQQTKCDLTWLVEGMKSNTLLWVTDGLYDWKKGADLSKVGLIIFCSKTRLRLTGNFWERSPVASSYWAEMLGLCALHLFVRALSEFHKI